ncbi:glycosyltransferase family 39 protein [Simkania negevensis]|uniref:Glycosyltransferase family 39 protein n=1 Tax=Simkania negevensis TaxID=83561 RepID=A0ABS3AUQ0_9BACT|nr:glycosyltransferase family 39 protein [Simkania negevensis]
MPPLSSSIARLSFRHLAALAAIKIVGAILLILYSDIGLSPDEAQYWTWSQDLGWGYYSKPPGIAWQIWLTTQLFGNTELGIRFGAVVISTLITFALYALARSAGIAKEGAFWAGAMIALSPLGILSTFAATTDGGAILFLILAAIPCVKAVRKQETPNFLLVGLFLACGLLYKWTPLILWLPILCFATYTPSFRKKTLPCGMALSLLGLFPSLVWNTSHDWATYRHLLGQLLGGPGPRTTKPLFHGNFFEFLAGQFAVLSPIFFLLLITAIVYAWRKRKQISPPIIFLFSFAPILLSYFLLSLLNKIQANWTAYLYPFLCAATAWYATTHLKNGKRWLLTGATLSIILSSLTMTIPYIQTHSIVSAFPIPYKINPFRHSIGWKKLPKILTDAGYDPQKHFLFADSYQMTSILSFYSPGQKRAYFLNLHGDRKNQFSYWPQMQTQQQAIGFYFNAFDIKPLGSLINPKRNLAPLTPYFQNAEPAGTFALFSSYTLPSKGGVLYKCFNYNGLQPKKAEKY